MIAGKNELDEDFSVPVALATMPLGTGKFVKFRMAFPLPVIALTVVADRFSSLQSLVLPRLDVRNMTIVDQRRFGAAKIRRTLTLKENPKIWLAQRVTIG